MAEGVREYRDRLFCFIFGNEAHKEWTLSLYNAVNGSHYTDPEQITIATLRQVVYMGMHNDVAFLVADEINLYEQQSTFNPNMPLRLMQYTGNIYEKLITLQRKNKYGKALIPLPVPKLVVFYNGAASQPEQTTLRLSDAFPVEKRDEADIAVRVRMININRGHSPEVVAACAPLTEYTWLVDRVRHYEDGVPLERAIDAALDEMPKDFMIKPYLDANRVEVKKMLLTEYNEAETLAMFKEEGRTEGEQKLGILITKLKSLGRIDDAFLAASDPMYRSKLYREFGMA
ncbi:MAG: Rpn family recombination-promoting nuclease/putative transposase [Clostridia bacterium]|nr:Rpn family recombination-promoting nuclease/putative transposase [Clostridia bacterium]